MAIAERRLGAEFNRDGHTIVDHWTYGICSDGDLQEGIASEAASLAGHLRLGKLVFLYDDNHVQLDGPTSMAWSEDVLERFDAYHWHTQRVEDGNDVEAIAGAIEAARNDARPSLIAVRTHIGGVRRSVRLELREELIEKQTPQRFGRSRIAGEQRAFDRLGQVLQREDRPIGVGEIRCERPDFVSGECLSGCGGEAHGGRVFYLACPRF